HAPAPLARLDAAVPRWPSGARGDDRAGRRGLAGARARRRRLSRRGHRRLRALRRGGRRGGARAYKLAASAAAVSLPATTGTISHSIRSDHSATHRWSSVTSSHSINWKHRATSAETYELTNFRPSGIERPLSRS